jgi:hypothetical protein
MRPPPVDGVRTARKPASLQVCATEVAGGQEMASPLVRNTVGLTTGLAITLGLIWAARYLPTLVTAPRAARRVTVIPPGAADVSSPKPTSDQVRVEKSRSKPPARAERKALLFTGEYQRSKVCLPVGEKSLALFELNKFKGVKIRGSTKTLRDQFTRAGSCFSALGRLRGGSESLVEGRTYTVRLMPSDETWTQIEKGSNSISLWGGELEVVPNPN